MNQQYAKSGRVADNSPTSSDHLQIRPHTSNKIARSGIHARLCFHFHFRFGSLLGMLLTKIALIALELATLISNIMASHTA
jgi:hypothetical protein